MKTLSELIAEHNAKLNELPKFVYEGVILNGSYDIFPSPYSPMQKIAGHYYLYVYKGGIAHIYASPNGSYDWSSERSAFAYGSVGYDMGKVLVAYHKWFENKSYFRFQSSLDGMNFLDIATIREPYGEDISWIKTTSGKYRAYVRMAVPPAMRTIGWMESADFRTWTTPVEVLVPDEEDNGKEFYSVSPIETQMGTFGFLNVFNPTNDAMAVQLVFSEDGKGNWQRLNNRQPVLTRKDGAKQLYATASVIDDKVIVNCITAKFGHSESDRNGRFYYTTRYSINLQDLYKFLN